ncbi:MAG: DUF2335 domain-containing protein [Bacillota bacterium]
MASQETPEILTPKKTILIGQRFEGPIPPPEFLAKYDDICPGFANRILTMAEKQSDHRQYIEKIIVKSDSRDSILGIICGYLIGTTAIVSGAIVIALGQPWSGAVLSVSGVAGLVGVFIYGTRRDKPPQPDIQDPKRTGKKKRK